MTELLDDDAMLAAHGHGTAARINVALDALAVINNLLAQADAMEENAALIDALRPTLWATACQHPSPMHPSLLCYLEAGHDGEHLYTVMRGRAA